MVLSNEMVLLEQYANDKGPGQESGVKNPLKLKHVKLEDIQGKLQICPRFNIWRYKKSQLSAVCMIQDHFP